MEVFTGYLENGSILYVNVSWCGHCKRARPIMTQIAQQLGGAVPVYDVDGDMWKQFLQKNLGDDAPKSYPTILFLGKDGSTVEFDDERTFQNLMAFACLNASTARGEIAACNAY
jgi:thiol-disulfide isomerase/thioredoxin